MRDFSVCVSSRRVKSRKACDPFVFIAGTAVVVFVSLASIRSAAQSNPQIQSRQIDDRNFGITFKYPEISGAGRFTAAVKGIIDPLLESYRHDMAGAKPAEDCVAGYINGNYSAAFLKNGIISVLLEWREYYPCAAHPGGGSASINYDTGTHRVLVLSDLFRPGVD